MGVASGRAMEAHTSPSPQKHGDQGDDNGGQWPFGACRPGLEPGVRYSWVRFACASLDLRRLLRLYWASIEDPFALIVTAGITHGRCKSA